MKKRNPMLAAVLILFLGPIGFVFVGWRYALLAFILLLFFASVLTVVGFPAPWWIKYFILPALAYKGYKIVSFRNNLISDGDQDVRYLNTFCGATIAMSDALVLIAVIYCLVVGIFASFKMLLAGVVFSGLIAATNHSTAQV